MHLVLPGGTRSLSDPEYELLPDSKAPLVGTLVQVRASISNHTDPSTDISSTHLNARLYLVQVRAHVRLDDSRQLLLVQGLSRVHVLRPTQAEPYSRADVQLMPDVEVLRYRPHT